MRKFAFLLLGLPLLAQAFLGRRVCSTSRACSCDLFCPCYFNDHASHLGTGAHSCNFNNVARIAVGKYGETDLTGIKVWLSATSELTGAPKARCRSRGKTYLPPPAAWVSLRTDLIQSKESASHVLL